MTTPHGVRPQQGHNVLVRQAHAIKDITHMLNGFRTTPLVGIRETAVRRRRTAITFVLPARGKGNLGPAGFFDRHDTGVRIEIGVAEGGELGLDGFQGTPGNAETGVGAPSRFGVETHASAVGTARIVRRGKGARTMPGEANKGTVEARSVAALFHVGFHDFENGLADLGQVGRTTARRSFLGKDGLRSDRPDEGGGRRGRHGERQALWRRRSGGGGASVSEKWVAGARAS
jgi:hypothetical protein